MIWSVPYREQRINQFTGHQQIPVIPLPPFPLSFVYYSYYSYYAVSQHTVRSISLSLSHSLLLILPRGYIHTI